MNNQKEIARQNSAISFDLNWNVPDFVRLVRLDRICYGVVVTSNGLTVSRLMPAVLELEAGAVVDKVA